MRRTALLALIVIASGSSLSGISACSGANDGETPPLEPTVTVIGPSAAIPAGSTYQFSATVAHLSNTSVAWSIDPVTGNTNVGAISTAGLYSAPNAVGTFTVRATSSIGVSGTAKVTVSAPVIGVSVAPNTLSMGAGGTLQLSASVTGSSNGAVTWDLPGGASAGSVVSTGSANATYTAPNTLGTYQVRATSVADPTRTATAAITVATGSGFRITGSTRVAPNATTQFTASLNDVAESATWTIDGAANGCTVTATGVFTAAARETLVTLRATDAAGRTATTQVAVAAQVTLDILVPANATISTADMLTFYWSVSPTGVSSDVNWSVSPASSGTTVPVDYFRGFIPSTTPGIATLTATSVADPTVKASFNATVTAAAGPAFSAPPGTPQNSRYEHAAATLPDGRIVLIGGQRSRGAYAALTSSEVFNPATGVFTNGPTLNSTRIKSEAIAIDANRVLVTGGVEDYNLAFNSGEIADVASGISTAVTNTMNSRRLLHQMAPITTGANAGKIAIIGGFNGPIPYGVPTWVSSATVDLFDPATNRFSAYSASMKSARGAFTATPLLDGRILIVGGYDAGSFTTLASAEIFDPVAGTFTFTGSMSKPRSAHTATRLANGSVLIVGGSNNGNDGTSAELYNPATGLFETVNGSMTVSRTNHAAALLGDGRVAVIGGESGDNFVRGSVEVYDPASRTFSALGHMSAARRRPTANVITSGPNAGRILVFGGGAEDRVGTTAEIVR